MQCFKPDKNFSISIKGICGKKDLVLISDEYMMKCQSALLPERFWNHCGQGSGDYYFINIEATFGVKNVKREDMYAFILSFHKDWQDLFDMKETIKVNWRVLAKLLEKHNKKALQKAKDNIAREVEHRFGIGGLEFCVAQEAYEGMEPDEIEKFITKFRLALKLKIEFDNPDTLWWMLAFLHVHYTEAPDQIESQKLLKHFTQVVKITGKVKLEPEHLTYGITALMECGKSWDEISHCVDCEQKMDMGGLCGWYFDWVEDQVFGKEKKQECEKIWLEISKWQSRQRSRKNKYN